MKKIIDRIVESPGEPGKNDLWLKTNIDGSSELKHFSNGGWKGIAGGSGSDSGGDEGAGDGYVKYTDLVPQLEINLEEPESVYEVDGGTSYEWRRPYGLLQSYAAQAIMVHDTASSVTIWCNREKTFDGAGFMYTDSKSTSIYYITSPTFNGWVISHFEDTPK